ncbi:MAG: hypothetical protein ABJB03_04770 [Rhodoglobus sp.]
MRRWAAVIVAAGALLGVVIAGIVFGSAYISQAYVAATVADTPGSGYGVPPLAGPTSTPFTGATSEDATTPVPVDDTPLPSAENPWPGGLIPEDLNSRIGAAETALITPCMAALGFTYVAPGAMASGDSQQNTPEYRFALGGDTGAGDEYHWEDAGCYGMAVHEMGMDNAN